MQTLRAHLKHINIFVPAWEELLFRLSHIPNDRLHHLSPTKGESLEWSLIYLFCISYMGAYQSIQWYRKKKIGPGFCSSIGIKIRWAIFLERVTLLFQCHWLLVQFTWNSNLSNILTVHNNLFFCDKNTLEKSLQSTKSFGYSIMTQIFIYSIYIHKIYITTFKFHYN